MKTISEERKGIIVQEYLHIHLSAVVIGVALNFRDWVVRGVVEIDYLLASFILVVIIAFILIVVRTLAQKYIAYRQGYLTTYTVHKWGLPASIFTIFFFSGAIPYVPPGELRIAPSKRMRLGAFRYGMDNVDLALIGLAGTIVCVLAMILVKPFWFLTNSLLVHKVVATTAAIAIGGLIPINGSEGFRMLYYRRWLWVWVSLFTIIYFVLILSLSIFSYVIAFILGLVGLIIYLRFAE